VGGVRGDPVAFLQTAREILAHLAINLYGSRWTPAIHSIHPCQSPSQFSDARVTNSTPVHFQQLCLSLGAALPIDGRLAHMLTLKLFYGGAEKILVFLIERPRKITEIVQTRFLSAQLVDGIEMA